MTNVTHNSFQCVYLHFNSLHVSSTSCSSSGDTNCINTTSSSCHSVSVAVSCAGRNFLMIHFNIILTPVPGSIMFALNCLFYLES